MKKNIFTRLLSAVILLSVLVSLLTVFPSADNTGAENEQKNSDALNVIYNRDFDEGWNYTNGLSAKYAAENIFGIEYTKVTASKYNHYLSVVSMGEKSGYLSLDAQKHTPTSGKVFLELDLRATSDTHLGTVVTALTAGEAAYAEHNYLVSLVAGDLYLLGEYVAPLDGMWHTLCFSFDFGYSATGEYEITAYYGEGQSVSKTFEVYGAKYGIGELRIGVPDNQRSGQRFDIDNLKLYSGSES